MNLAFKPALRFSSALLALTLPLRLAPQAHAASVAIPNFSFEEDETRGDANATAAITGWKAKGNPKFAFACTNDPGEEFDGAKGRRGAPKMQGYQIAYLWTPCTLQSAESLVTVEAGVTYTLKVAIGDPRLDQQEPGQLQIGFLIGDQSPDGSSDTIDGNDGTAEGTFDDYSFSYTATQADAGKSLKIFFRTLDENAAVGVDNFRLNTSG